MPFLSLVNSVKKILLNPKALIIVTVIIVTVVAFYYFKITNLEKDLAISQQNSIKLQDVNSINVDTVKKLEKQLKYNEESQKIVVNSYIKDIDTYKKIISNLKKKVVYKDKIVIKTKKVPVYKEGKTIYVNKCEPIEVHKLDDNDSNTSIQRILSTIGK